jgi:predicted SAM-dependent methyltransferase
LLRFSNLNFFNPIREQETLKNLNLGCGSLFFPSWVNIDFLPRPCVQGHNLTKPLPFADDSFDATYSSHVLEHFSRDQGKNFIQEQFRVLKKDGFCRVVVPDLEMLCRSYLDKLDKVSLDDKNSILSYEWGVIELIDQMTREFSGGQMRAFLNKYSNQLNEITDRIGDEALAKQGREVILVGERSDIPVNTAKLSESVSNRLKRKWLKFKSKFSADDDPRKSGEAHKWMYDRVSLANLMSEVGFTECEVTTFDQSRIPNWSEENLDISLYGNFPRKPDSLYMEGIKG